MRKRTCWWSFIKKDSLCQRSLLWQRRLINQRFLVDHPIILTRWWGWLVRLRRTLIDLSVSRYAPWIKRIPLEQGLRFEPTRKALPTHSLTKRVWVGRRKLSYRKIRNFRSSFTSFSHELGAFQWLLVVGHSQGTQWSHACLWPPRIRYAFDVRNKTFTPEDLDWFERRIR